MFILIFIAVFGTSIIGATIFGVSLNKVALIPLEIYLLFSSGVNLKFKVNNRQKTLLYWYIVMCLGSLSGILFSLTYNERITDVLIKKAIMQIFSYVAIYMPIALLIWNSKKREIYLKYFKKAFILVARIQAIWGVLQFGIYHLFGININQNILGVLFGGNWTALSNLANSSVGVVLRVSGINRDAAFFGALLVIGFILDENSLFKFVYVVCAALALSRVALVAIAFVLFYQFLIKFKDILVNHKVKLLGRYILIMVVFIVVFILIYNNSPALQKQITRVLERFLTVSTGADGTNRHMGYPLATLQLETLNIPLIQKLFGVGNGSGGILLSYYSNEIEWLGLSSSMKELTSVWAVESDIANIFLETGLIGGIFYYIFYYKSYKFAKYDITKRCLVLTMAVFGIMYNLAGITFMQILYITLFASDFKLSGLPATNKNINEI